MSRSNTALLKAYLCLLLCCIAFPASAANISIPLQLGNSYIQHQLLKQVFTEPGQSYVAWDDGSGCNHFVLSNPKVTSSTEGIKLRLRGEGRVGTPVGDNCVPLVPWRGHMNFLLEPSLSQRTNMIVLTVTDSSAGETSGDSEIASTIWKWTKNYVHPRLSGFRIDFGKPLSDLASTAPQLFPRSDMEQVRNILTSLQVKEVYTTSAGTSVVLNMDVPDDRMGPESVRPEPSLTTKEVAQLSELLRYWDVFVTLIAKQAAAAVDDKLTRDQLLDILVQARYGIVAALSQDHVSGDDPVRALFLDTWTKLSPVLRSIAIQVPGESAIDLLGFIGAVDALQAIDAAAPWLNLDISRNGLRRLARLIEPGLRDPLIYIDSVDPELRQLFDFGEPIEAPEQRLPPSSAIDWLIRSSLAQDVSNNGTLFDLNTWIPHRTEIFGYLVRVRWLLEDIVMKLLRDKPLDSTYREIFHPLMLASAWQESCWRQFVLKNGEKAPIRSGVGAVGIMQVSPTVWRGFYQPEFLTWNIHYNARAGGEILHHYLTRYAVRKEEHLKTSNLHNLARATYSAYHGGPSHLTRYRRSNTSNTLKRIDDSFWKKYETIRDGDSLAVEQCYQ